jgi:catechol 2,3-dioxygenase-like lactoylglutathione lyase family enzyme
MAVREFMHIGITVSDMDKMVGFYTKWFGFKKVGGLTFPPEFFSDSKSLYHLEDGVYSDMVLIESEDQRCVLELFQFSNVEIGGTIEWNKTGLHHLAFKVESIPELYERMRADGVEFFFAPKERVPGTPEHWIFFKDPDGNMLELWD